MMNREIRKKLEHFPSTIPTQDQEVRINDRNYKERIKQYHDKWHRATQLHLENKQAVIVKRDKKRKAETTYEPQIYIVTQMKGSTIHAKRLGDGKTICRYTPQVSTT